MVDVVPQHHRTRLVQHHLGVDDAHQVDHPQMLALIPGAVIVDGHRVGVGDGLREALGLIAEPVVGDPQLRCVGRLETTQTVGPFLQRTGVGEVLEHLTRRCIDVALDGAVGAEHLIVRIHRSQHVHDDRSGGLTVRVLDPQDAGDHVFGDVTECGQGSRHDLSSVAVLRNGAKGGISSGSQSTAMKLGPVT